MRHRLTIIATATAAATTFISAFGSTSESSLNQNEIAMVKRYLDAFATQVETGELQAFQKTFESSKREEAFKALEKFYRLTVDGNNAARLKTRMTDLDHLMPERETTINSKFIDGEPLPPFVYSKTEIHNSLLRGLHTALALAGRGEILLPSGIRPIRIPSITETDRKYDRGNRAPRFGELQFQYKGPIIYREDARLKFAIDSPQFFNDLKSLAGITFPQLNFIEVQKVENPTSPRTLMEVTFHTTEGNRILTRSMLLGNSGGDSWLRGRSMKRWGEKLPPNEYISLRNRMAQSYFKRIAENPNAVRSSIELDHVYFSPNSPEVDLIPENSGRKFSTALLLAQLKTFQENYFPKDLKTFFALMDRSPLRSVIPEVILEYEWSFWKFNQTPQARNRMKAEIARLEEIADFMSTRPELYGPAPNPFRIRNKSSVTANWARFFLHYLKQEDPHISNIAWHLFSDFVRRNHDSSELRGILEKELKEPNLPLSVANRIDLALDAFRDDPPYATGEEIRDRILELEKVAEEQKIRIKFVPSQENKVEVGNGEKKSVTVFVSSNRRGTFKHGLAYAAVLGRYAIVFYDKFLHAQEGTLDVNEEVFFNHIEIEACQSALEDGQLRAGSVQDVFYLSRLDRFKLLAQKDLTSRRVAQRAEKVEAKSTDKRKIESRPK